MQSVNENLKIIGLKNSELDILNVRELSHQKEDQVEHKKKRIIPIVSDSMFKTLFLREEYIQFPCKLLSYIIDMSYEELLNHLKFTKAETGVEKQKDTKYRSDMVVDVDGVKINVEMNNNGSEQVRNRNISYLMRIREDQKANESFGQVIQVNLNNYCYHNDTKVRRDFAFLDHDGVLLTNQIIIVDIYLPNIIKKSYNESREALSEMERFLLIGMEQNRKKTLEYVGDDIVMKKFEETIENKTQDKTIVEEYDKEWEWKDLGRQEERYSLVENMIKANIPMPKIIECTELSEEQVIAIKNTLNEL